MPSITEEQLKQELAKIKDKVTRIKKVGITELAYSTRHKNSIIYPTAYVVKSITTSKDIEQTSNMIDIKFINMGG